MTKLVPRHHSFTNYPACSSILSFIESQKILKNRALREGDLDELLEVLTWENRLERMPSGGYRTVWRPPHGRDPESSKLESGRTGSTARGLIDAPCGSCPVFNDCTENGPISPNTCIYFQNWLRFDF